MINRHTKLSHDLPARVKSEADWRQVCEWMLDAVGMGFHPDTSITEYVDAATGRRSFDAGFARKTVQPTLDSAREAVAEGPLYDIAFEAMMRRYPEIGADYRE